MITAVSTFLNADTGSVVEVGIAGHTVAAFLRPVGAGPNQDSAAVIELEEERCVLVVADGMGGGQSGDRASALAIETMIAQIADTESSGQPLRAGILNGFEVAHQRITETLSGAATTLLVAEIQADQARLYHVGDSAACVFGQRGKVKMQTGSHSPVGYALRSGLLDENEAMQHSDRHYVSNMVGLQDMSVEVGLPFTLAPKDTLVLASDGLFDNLLLQEIVDAGRLGTVTEAAQRLSCRTLRRMVDESSAVAPGKPDDLVLLVHRLLGSRRRSN